EQLAAAIAADREQRQPCTGGNTAQPGLADQLVNRAGAQREQAFDVVGLLEAFAQARIGVDKRLPGIGSPLHITGSICRRVQTRARRQLAHACVVGACSDSAGDKVSTSTPSSVTAMVCSHCADNLRSLVTTVQPSGSTLVWRAPSLIIGSM